MNDVYVITVIHPHLYNRTSHKIHNTIYFILSKVNAYCWAFFITIKQQDACLLLFYEKGDYLKNEQSYYGKYIAGVVHALPLEPYNFRNL